MSPDRIVSEGAARAPASAGTRFRVFPLLLMFVMLLAMVGIGYLWPSPSWIAASVRDFGVLLAAVGTILVAVAAGLFRRRGTTVNPYGESSSLVQNGLYRFSRNPMYLGMALVLGGAALWLGQAAGFILLGVFVVVVSRFNIRLEERALEARFGDEYRAYQRRVRRWI